MCQWRIEVTSRLAETAVSSNNAAVDEYMNNHNEVLGWADLFTGTQTQATQQGGVSLVSLFASPPSGRDHKTGKGSGEIQGSAANTQSPAAQEQPKAMPNTEEARAGNAFDGPPAETRDSWCREVLAPAIRPAWEDLH